MRRAMIAALALALAAPAGADEVEETVQGALEAYRAGDIAVAREDLEYALRLLGEMKAAALVTFLPEPLPGWTRQAEDVSGQGPALALLGGGSAASASYTRGGEEFSISIMADSPMVSGLAAMFSGMASLGGGKTVRIQRQQFMAGDGEIQGIVGGRILVQASGSAPVEAMQAHIEAMDLQALADY